MPYTVKLYAANGRALNMHVHAASESAATRYALTLANRNHPGEGWRAFTALEGWAL